MSKKSIKIISTMLTIALIVMSFATTSFAANSIGGVDVEPNTNVSGMGNITQTGNKILGLIQTIGVLFAVGILMVLGIKYMMGSAEEKASYKKTMLPYVIGAVLLFAASTLANVVYQFATGI